MALGAVSAGLTAIEPEGFHLRDRFREDLNGEFTPRGEVESNADRHRLGKGAMLVWEADSGPQFGLELQPAWPPQSLESLTQLELILVPQGALEFGLSALGSGQPCGVSIRNVHIDGQFLWELSLRSYQPSLRTDKLLARRLVEQTQLPETLRLTYNYGVLSLDLTEGEVLEAHLDNFCAEVRQIQLRNGGQPVGVSQIRGRRSAKSSLPSFVNRLRLGRAAIQDAQVQRLIDEEEYDKALRSQANIHETCLEILGQRHFYTIRSATTRAMLHRISNQREQALQLGESNLQAARAEFGPDHPETCKLLEERAALALQGGDWLQAEPLYREAHRIRQREAIRPFGAYLRRRAGDFEDELSWDAAILLRRKILEVRREAYSNRHWRVQEAESDLSAAQRRSDFNPSERQEIERADGLIGSAGALMEKGQLLDALNRAEQALEIRKRVLGLEDRETAVAATHLGIICKKLGRYEEAMNYYAMDMEITRKVQGPRHPEYASVLNNVAVVLAVRNQYEEAERLHKQALAIREAEQAEAPDRFAESLSNLGRLYAFEMGRLERGLPLIEESYRVRLRHYASDGIEVSRSLNNLGHCYMRIGDTKRATAHFRKSLEIKQQAIGEDSLGYANTLLALGNTLNVAGRPAEAKPLLLQAVATVERLAGVDNAYYPQFVNYLAAALTDLGEMESALQRYHEALQIRSKQVGADHSDCGEIHINLARTYLQREDTAAAERHCQEALRIFSQAGKASPRGRQAAENLEIHLKIVGGRDLQTAFESNSRLLEAKQLELRKRLPLLSEPQQIAQLNALRGQLHQQLELGRLTRQPAQDIYRHVLTWKSVIAFRSLTDRLVRSEEVDRVQEQLIAVRDKLAAHVFRRSQQDSGAYLRALEQLEAEKERLQRISAQLAESNRDRWDVNPRLLAERLPAGRVLIDFLQSRRLDGESRLEAFVIRRPAADGAPWIHWLDLGAAGLARARIARWRAAILEGQVDSEAASQLRSMLWAPIEACFGAPPRYAYLCPDGILAAMPWAALPGASPESFLIEEVTLATLPLSQFLFLQPASGDTASAADHLLLVGNLDYSRDLSPPISKPALLATRVAAINDSQSWRFPPLPGTREEIQAIEKMAAPRHVVKLERKAATKEATIAALRQADYAHFASHGFFANAESEDEASPVELSDAAAQRRQDTLQRNPFLMSGLVLSGANQGAGDASLRDSPPASDGLLTAEAIASLPLDHLRIATLSACETQLGQIAGGEGVYGLQRAFHLAGAQHVVASLWKVEDRATASLMKLFYHFHWEKSLPPVEALRAAQITLLREPQILQGGAAFEAVLQRGIGVKQPVAVARERAPTGSRALRKTAPIRQWAAFSISGM